MIEIELELEVGRRGASCTKRTMALGGWTSGSTSGDGEDGGEDGEQEASTGVHGGSGRRGLVDEWIDWWS